MQEHGEGEADSPLSREPNGSLIPGPRDHDLSQRQMLNQLSHLGAPKPSVLIEITLGWKKHLNFCSFFVYASYSESLAIGTMSLA